MRAPVPARHAAAFSLIEVLIAIGVLAIAGALMAPLLGEDDITKLRSAAGLLVADLEYAQVESITHGADPRLVIFNSVTETYYIAAASSPATPLTNPADRMPYSTTFGAGRARSLAGVGIQSYSLGGDDRVRFGAYGQLDQSTPATVTLACGARRITVTLDPSTGATSVGAVQ